MSSIYRITPRAVGSPTVTGRVHGNGGMLSGEDGLRKLHFFATTGRFGGYQPSPGHVRVYPQWSAAGDGLGVDVPIARATIQLVTERCELPGCPQTGLDGHSHGQLMTERWSR